MTPSDLVRQVRILGRGPRIGAIVVAEQAVDTCLAHSGARDRAAALDALLADLARLRGREPAVGAFVGEVEHYVDLLRRELEAAPRPRPRERRPAQRRAAGRAAA